MSHKTVSGTLYPTCDTPNTLLFIVLPSSCTNYIMYLGLGLLAAKEFVHEAILYRWDERSPSYFTALYCIIDFLIFPYRAGDTQPGSFGTFRRSVSSVLASQRCYTKLAHSFVDTDTYLFPNQSDLLASTFRVQAHTSYHYIIIRKQHNILLPSMWLPNYDNIFVASHACVSATEHLFS